MVLGSILGDTRRRWYTHIGLRMIQAMATVIRRCVRSKKGCSPRRYCVIRSCFRSNQLLLRHLHCHHVTRPAAQRQQDDHEGEEKKAHRQMILWLQQSSFT